jgi:hypothetical protein
MPSTPTYKNLDALLEQPESGRIEVSRSGRLLTKIYKAKYSVCTAAIKSVDTVGSGDTLGYLVRTSTVERSKGSLGILTDVWAAGGDDADPGDTPLPADEIGINPTNQAPRTERHPRYVSLAGISGELANVEDALRGTTATARAVAYSLLSATGKELVDKIRAGNESYYLATIRYSWATHSYSAPTSTRGGFRQSISGPLASYFTGTIEWLREADDVQYSNGIWRRTMSWLGADKWDAQIYA